MLTPWKAVGFLFVLWYGIATLGLFAKSAINEPNVKKVRMVLGKRAILLYCEKGGSIVL